MSEETRNALIAAIWKAMDESQDEAEVGEIVEQAFKAWVPDIEEPSLHERALHLQRTQFEEESS